MSGTYVDYLKTEQSLSFEKAVEIHSRIIEAVGSHPDLQETYALFLKACVSYSEIRAKWAVMSVVEKADADEMRTGRHDSVIIHINMLSRHVKAHGRDCNWIDSFGEPKEDPYMRKRIGDFACYVACIGGLLMR